VNGFQVQDAWIKHAQSQRERDERERESARTFNECVAWCARALPDLNDDQGNPCPIAYLGALELRRRRGTGNVTANAVREWRARYIADKPNSCLVIAAGDLAAERRRQSAH